MQMGKGEGTEGRHFLLKGGGDMEARMKSTF